MPTFEEFKAEGNSAFSNKQYIKAAKIYRDAIAHHGDNPVIYSNRAQCFLCLKDWTRAYRDAALGLQNTPNDKIKLKLLFRKGTAAKELGFEAEAIQLFQEVLSIDPANSGAQEELAILTNVPKSKKLKADDGTVVPVELVDELPREFADILSAAPTPAEPKKTVEQTVEQAVNSELVDSAAEELFGKKPEKPRDATQAKEYAPKSFVSMPSMHFLKGLKSVAPEEKARSYQYVTRLEDSVLVSHFQTSGVDYEFFEFFVEASTFVIVNESDKRTTHDILRKLRLMSTFNRFSLTLTMCDDKLLQKLISEVKRVSPDVLQQLEQILSSS